jgi:hypothetical protein
MFTVAGRYSVVLARLIEERLTQLKEQISTGFIPDLEDLRRRQGEIAGLQSCYELMAEADRLVSNGERE